MTDLDPILAALDWPVCECEADSCNGQCANEATMRTEFHALDHCTSVEDELTEDGNRVLALCVHVLRDAPRSRRGARHRARQVRPAALHRLRRPRPLRQGRHPEGQETVICLPAQLLGAATVLLPLVGLIIGLLIGLSK